MRPLPGRWVITYAPECDQQFRRRQQPVGRSWRMHETAVRVNGAWNDLYRAGDKGKGAGGLPDGQERTGEIIVQKRVLSVPIPAELHPSDRDEWFQMLDLRPVKTTPARPRRSESDSGCRPLGAPAWRSPRNFYPPKSRHRAQIRGGFRIAIEPQIPDCSALSRL